MRAFTSEHRGLGYARDGARWLSPLLIILLFTISCSWAQRTLPIQVAPGVLQVGSIEHYALIESSGLTQSRAHPGVFWSHNDTENPTFLFALTREGDHIGAYELQGARVIDLEAIAAGAPGYLYLADTGTNGMARTHSAIHRVIEPDLSKSWGHAEVVETWFIRFPGVREDCEGFFVFNGFGYLIGKYPVEGRVPLYRFSLADESESILLEEVGRISLIEDEGTVSDMDLAPDSSRLGLVTSEGVISLFIDGNPESVGRAPRRTARFRNANLEGGTYVPDGFLVTGETTRAILLFNNPFLAGAPIITSRLDSQTVFEGDTVEFEVLATGFPRPSLQWTFNDTPIPGETNASLVLTDVQLGDAGTYGVIATNIHGSAQASTTLTVLERELDLRVTEVLSSQIVVDPTNEDWWELTSFDPRTNDLSGWMYNESTGGLFDAFTIPEGTVIRPGESIIFVEDMTREEFLAWWGPEHFETNVQVITFTGLELSLSSDGDTIRLWNEEGELVVSLPFGAAQTGVSFIQNPDTGLLNVLSQTGVRGAFQAAIGGDIGSPGRADPPPPTAGVALAANLLGEMIELSIAGEPQGGYVLEATSDLDSGSWSVEGAFGTNETSREIEINGTAVRFFRLRKE